MRAGFPGGPGRPERRQPTPARQAQARAEAAARACAAAAQREAAEREAPEREAPEREAPEREAPEREAPEREAPEREAPEREVPGPPQHAEATETGACDPKTEQSPPTSDVRAAARGRSGGTAADTKQGSGQSPSDESSLATVSVLRAAPSKDGSPRSSPSIGASSTADRAAGNQKDGHGRNPVRSAVDGAPISSPQGSGSVSPATKSEPNSIREQSTRGSTVRSGPAVAVSERKRAAQQKNGKKAAGKKSPLGKQASALNALKHGFYSDRDYIPAGPFAEDPDQIEATIAAIVAALAPRNPAAEAWAHRVARALQSEARLDRAETLAFTSTEEDNPSHFESLASNSRKHQRALSSLYDWSIRAQDAIAEQESSDWRKVVATTFAPREAQRFAETLRMRLGELDAGDFTDEARRPTTEREWQAVVRAFLEQYFDGDLSALASFAAGQIEAVAREEQAFDRRGRSERALIDAVTAQRQVPDILRLIEVRAKASRTLAVVMQAFEAAQKWGS